MLNKLSSKHPTFKIVIRLENISVKHCQKIPFLNNFENFIDGFNIKLIKRIWFHIIKFLIENS
jgi:hypothetical protein